MKASSDPASFSTVYLAQTQQRRRRTGFASIQQIQNEKIKCIIAI